MTPQRELEIEVARRWLEKAAGDLRAAEACAPVIDVPGWVIGFHCQQAVEKACKGMLVLASSAPPRTHDVVHLVRLLEGVGRDPPLGDRELVALSPFSVSERYPILSPDDAAPCDRPALIAFAQAAVARLEADLRDAA